jgi:DinB superfamily
MSHMSNADSWCDCGFNDDSVRVAEVGDRVVAGAADLVSLMQSTPALVSQRPDAGRWSALEYAAHVRDVLLTIRDRVVIGLVEDRPGFKPMYRDERVNLGLYGADGLDDVTADLVAVSVMFKRLFSAVDPASLDRAVLYGFPNPDVRTVGWMGCQAVHEIEHHTADVRENLRLLAARA